MEPIKDNNEFLALLKYAVELKFGAPHSAKDVPTIGIVFGNYEIPSRCHEYMTASHDGNKLKIHITPGDITAKMVVSEIAEGDIILSCELNYDHPELLNFKDKTPPDGKVVLIFGVRRECQYYITGNFGDSTKDFSPMVLAGYTIALLKK